MTIRYERVPTADCDAALAIAATANHAGLKAHASCDLDGWSCMRELAEAPRKRVQKLAAQATPWRWVAGKATTIYLHQDQVGPLDVLSARTGWSVAKLIRLGVDMVLAEEARLILRESQP